MGITNRSIDNTSFAYNSLLLDVSREYLLINFSWKIRRHRTTKYALFMLFYRKSETEKFTRESDISIELLLTFGSLS